MTRLAYFTYGNSSPTIQNSFFKTKIRFVVMIAFIFIEVIESGGSIISCIATSSLIKLFLLHSSGGEDMLRFAVPA